MQPEEKNVKVVEEREQVSSDGGAVRREVVESNTSQASGAVLIKRIIWYIAGLIIVLLAIRVVLFMLGASEQSGFVQFIYNVTWIFAAPFYGIFPQPEYGRFGLDTASLVGIVVYALAAWGIGKLVTIDKSSNV